jgi:hypothetical protein
MKNLRSLMLAAAIVIALLLAAGALAQDGLLAGLVQPLVVNIEQQVPVDVTLSLPLDDGTIVTATAPLTVGIALQVNIDGAGVVAVTAGEAEPVELAAEAAPAPAASQPEAVGGALVDLSGIPYSVQTDLPVAITQVRSQAMFGTTRLVGEIVNNGDEELRYITLMVNFYDADGKLLDMGFGSVTADTLGPGETSGLNALASVELDDVARYTIEIE